MGQEKNYKITFNGKISSINGPLIKGADIKSIKLPKGLKSITPNAFSGCTGLTKIITGDSSSGFTRDNYSSGITAYVNGTKISFTL